jgi:uncharacterized OB-fold protein
VPAVISFPDADGVRLISNIVDSRIEDIVVGAKVTVTFDTLSSGTVIPRFRIVDSPA